MNYNKESREMLPMVDNKGNIIGCASRSECHSPLKLLHPVVHLHVLNKEGKILLQKRSMNKSIQPGKWDTAVGGHVDYGEDIETALMRESFEELGFKNFMPVQLDRYIFESPVEREMINSFGVVCDLDADSFEFSKDEIDEIRYFSFDEIESNR
ncbi:MAG: NUDIX domain-containing protein, partial [Muribaculaceae bacterium]|nr:NUDIX domain-containing protein [Muribaculaceae bacterium]